MKKLLMAAALFMSTFAAKADDAITASLKVTSEKNSATVHVDLSNPTGNPYVAFQFDITFPANMQLSNSTPTITARLENEETVNLSSVGGSDKESTTFKVETNWLSGNVLRVIGYNLGNKPIKQTSGEILAITVNATQPTENASDWTAKFETVDFVTENELNEVLLNISNENSTAVGQEDAALLGDANDDKKVDALDAILVLKYVLYNGDETKLTTPINKTNADVSKDGKIEALDAIAILKMKI